MHLVFDARHMCLPYSGLGRYSASLLQAFLDLPQIERLRQITVLVTPDILRNGVHNTLLAQLVEAPRFKQVTVDESPFGNPLQRRTVTQLRKLAADHYFFPHYDVPFGLSLPTTFVIHDLMPIRLQGYVRKHVLLKRSYFWLRTVSSLRRAHCCITVSAVTRQDVIESFGSRFADKIVPVHSGIPSRRSSSRRPPLELPYLLYVGDRRPHKNLPRLLDIFEELRRAHGYTGKLVMVGPKANHGFDPEADAAMRGLPVVFPGPVTDGELEGYYANAQAHFLISSYEGFGLPVIEAARHSTKCIVSDLGALPEIVPEGSCVLPSANSASEAAALVATYLASPFHPDGLVVEARFQWTITAQKILDSIFYGPSRSAQAQE